MKNFLKITTLSFFVFISHFGSKGMGYPLYCDAIKKTCEAKVSSTQTSICTPLFGANAEYIAEPMLHKKCRQLEESGVSGKDLCEQIVGYAAKTDTVYGERICTWDLRELH